MEAYVLIGTDYTDRSFNHLIGVFLTEEATSAAWHEYYNSLDEWDRDTATRVIKQITVNTTYIFDYDY